MSKLSSIVIFDTNVLLTKPTALLEYPNAEIVIPEVVLSELDKLKVARVDPDLRFRGREVSRLMFDLADGGSLTEGVNLPNGGRLRVMPLDISGLTLPDGFTTRSSDDKILATAYLLENNVALRGKACTKDCRVELVTNDLNMLLKAQTYHIDVKQYGSGDDISFSKRYIVRPFQRYRIPLAILGVSLGVFLAALLIAFLFWQGGTDAQQGLTTDQRALLTTEQENAFNALDALNSNPADASAARILADFFFERVEFSRQIGDDAGVIRDARTAIEYLERYLRMRPADNEARNDLAIMHFRSGNFDRAIQEVNAVLTNDPDDVQANLNLGTIYTFGRRDLAAARVQMERVLELTENDFSHTLAHETALQTLAFIDQEEAALQGDVVPAPSPDDATLSDDSEEVAE
jgi:tetratricopeptide (TPR) repeat protein